MKEDANNNGKEENIEDIPPFTSIAWDITKYHGTPLELTDRLVCIL